MEAQILKLVTWMTVSFGRRSCVDCTCFLIWQQQVHEGIHSLAFAKVVLKTGRWWDGSSQWGLPRTYTYPQLTPTPSHCSMPMCHQLFITPGHSCYAASNTGGKKKKDGLMAPPWIPSWNILPLNTLTNFQIWPQSSYDHVQLKSQHTSRSSTQ